MVFETHSRNGHGNLYIKFGLGGILVLFLTIGFDYLPTSRCGEAAACICHNL